MSEDKEKQGNGTVPVATFLDMQTRWQSSASEVLALRTENQRLRDSGKELPTSMQLGELTDREAYLDGRRAYWQAEAQKEYKRADRLEAAIAEMKSKEKQNE